jgi:hypothetical protein
MRPVRRGSLVSSLPRLWLVACPAMCGQQVPADSLYGTTIGSLRCDALPVQFDLTWWTARFQAMWPPGSPGHHAYFGRITGGTRLRLEHAARGGVDLG